jgi:putative ABC transport system substrate-binding protein
MKRREFIAGLSGAAIAWSPAARAQRSDHLRLLGVLSDSSAPIYQAVQRLRDLGWTEGRNVRIASRTYGWPDLASMRDLAAELVGMNPDVILTLGTPETRAVLEQTRAVPIVFTSIADPVGAGLVKSFARPGGNVTGFAAFEPEMGGKWLELLREISPKVTRIAAILHLDEMVAPLASLRREMEMAATTVKNELSIIPDDDAIALEHAVDRFAQEANGGLIVFPSVYTGTYLTHIIELAKRHRLPVVYPFAFWVKFGGLMSYGVDPADQCRRAASYVDRILKGAKPSDLPVQAPTEFKLAINLSTAGALGLTIPQSILLRADEVIE